MATTYLAPDPIQDTHFIPGSNTLANGAQLFFYLAGTTTKQTVYQDNAGATPWANPIVLVDGHLPSFGEVWFASGLSYKVVFAPATDTDPPTSPYWTKDDLVGMNDVADQLGVEWIGAPTPTFVSATSFAMAGNQTAAGQADIGRRIKLEDATTIYGSILARTFGSGSTTIQVLPDSGTLSASLSTAAYGFLTALNGSVPMQPGGRPLFMDPTDRSKLAQFDLSGVPTSTIVTIPINSSGVVGQSSSYVMLTSVAIIAGATSTVQFRSSDVDWTSFSEYEFHLKQLQPFGNATGLHMQLSINNASTFIEQYRIAAHIVTSGSSTENFGSTQSTIVLTASSMGQTSTAHLQGIVRLFAPNVTSNLKFVSIDKVIYRNLSTVATIVSMQGGVAYTTGSGINAVKFGYAAVNFSTGGRITVYGRK